MNQKNEEKIGVYVCHCGTNIAGNVNIEEVINYASNLPNVVLAKDYAYMCSDPGQDLIKNDIKEKGLTRVVVSSCSPLMHEVTFRKAVKEAGLNPYLCQMANIREQVSWVTEDTGKATEKAKRIITAAVRRVDFHEPLEAKEVPVNSNTLVVGGGIAGIEAALQIANSGKRVYLVEKEPTIGGHMAKFDKTFPTLDCAACILTPKMVAVGQHPNIELLSNSEIEDVEGYVGNFRVKVRKKARFVDEALCTGCGECVKNCPVELDSEFDEGLVKRNAIYRAFPQAVPNAFVIDKELQPCKAACPAGVGAPGYVMLTSQEKFKEALDLIKTKLPFPSICGRVCHRPCESACTRIDLDEPVAIAHIKRFVGDLELEMEAEEKIPEITRDERIAIVGAGPAGLTAAHDLRKMGYNVTIFESHPVTGGMMRLGIPEFRLPRKVLDKEISDIINMGIELKTNVSIGKDIKLGDLSNQGYRAIFLGIGAQKGQKLNIEGEDLDGVYQAVDFLRDINLGKKVELGNKVAVIGGGNAALDTARSALRCGAKEVSILYRRSRIEMPAEPEWEVDETMREGVEIEYRVAPKRILGKDGKVAGLECIKIALKGVTVKGRRRKTEFIEGSEYLIEVDNVISAIGQSVDTSVLANTELELTAWGTIESDPVTLETSREGVFSGGDAVIGAATVIEAVAAGKEAAISIDRYIKGEDLREGRGEKVKPVEVSIEGLEKKERINMPLLSLEERAGNFKEVELGYTKKMAVEEAKRCLICGVCSECLECVKLCEAKAIDHWMKDQYLNLDVGAIIIATGFNLFDCKKTERYGYKKFDNVINSLEFERLCHASGPTGGKILLKDGKAPQSIAILHCIGSRDTNFNEYCSRVCCMYSMKFAHLVREKVPEAKIYEFYIDLRAFGKGYEEFYKRVLNEDVIFIRGKGAEVTDVYETLKERGKLIVKCEDTLLGMVRRIPVDLVILGAGLEPRRDASEVAKLFSISRSKDGFFLEKHPKLAPVDTANAGIHIAGACQGPKDIPDTVAQGAAAAAGALSMIDLGRVEIEPITSSINEEVCGACKTCIALCPYSAIEFDKEKNVSVVNEVLCKGCGTCVAACPSGAAQQNGFTDKQIYAELEGALSLF